MLKLIDARHQSVDSTSPTDNQDLTPSRILKVKFKQRGIAKRVAKETGLKYLFGGKKHKVAKLKVRKNDDINSAIERLKAHPEVVKVKQIIKVLKYAPN